MPKKICNSVGCNMLVDISLRYCATHQSELDKVSELRKMNRPKQDKIYNDNLRDKSRHKFYTSSQWIKLRNIHLKSSPLCIICHSAGKIVDHIVELSDGGCSLCVDNLQTLCRSCHNVKTFKAKRAREVTPKNNIKINYLPDDIKEPRIEVTMVCGCYGAGKSSYILKNADPNDLVIDLDEIRCNVTNKNIYEWEDKEGLKESIDKRNEIINSLADKEISEKYEKVWFIVSASRGNVREWWANKLNANVLLIDVDQEECIRRVNCDSRRRHNIKTHIKAINKYFNKFSSSYIDTIIHNNTTGGGYESYE